MGWENLKAKRNLRQKSLLIDPSQYIVVHIDVAILAPVSKSSTITWRFTLEQFYAQLIHVTKSSTLKKMIQSKIICLQLAIPAPSHHAYCHRNYQTEQVSVLLYNLGKYYEDGGDQHDLFPPNACCKCYCFDNLGRLSSVKDDDESNLRINQVLHRRFLRQVRLKERRRRSDESVKRRYALDLNVDYDTEQLSTSVDYLVELCNTLNSVENRSSFANMSHQAVDFIIVSLKKFAKENKSGCIEGTVNSLVTRVIGRLCTPSPRDESPHSGDDTQLYVHHLLRELGAEPIPYIGQRIMFAVSQRISVLADSLLFMDPFDDTFPAANSCMFLLIQLVEFLISDYVQSWTNDEAFEISLFEDWLRSVVQARKALCSLESRNVLYVLYMDRVTGELLKQVGQVSCRQSLNPDNLENLLISH